MSIPRRISGTVSVDGAESVYKWVDSLNLSRPRRNITRDYADGVLVAEIIHMNHPQIVDLHNFVPSSSFPQKIHNWSALNMKVLKKLGIGLHPKDMEDCANMIPGSIEKVLLRVRKALNTRTISDSDTDVSRLSSCKDILMVQSTRSVRPDPIDELRQQMEAHQNRVKELENTVELLTLKNSKLEELIEIKDKKIELLKRY